MSYLPIRLTTLKSQNAFGFDVYIKLPHKLLLYVRGEDFLEPDRIKRLRDKKVRKLFIDDGDEDKYQMYIDKTLENAMKDDSLSLEDKSTLVVDSGEATAERIFEDPQSKKSYDAAQSTTSNLISVLSQNDELLKGIFDRTIDEANDSIENRMHKHSVNTAALALSFAEFLGRPKAEVELLGVAGLFHDVAYSSFPHDKQGLFCQEMDTMEASDLTFYKTHPEVGAEILQDKDFASKEIIDLILSHEEKRGGNGFPNKLTKLEPAQEILSLCAFFDREVTCRAKQRDAVFTDFNVGQLGNYDLEIMKSFKEFVKKSGLG